LAEQDLVTGNHPFRPAHLSDFIMGTEPKVHQDQSSTSSLN
jgi:hypothetical protein